MIMFSRAPLFLLIIFVFNSCSYFSQNKPTENQDYNESEFFKSLPKEDSTENRGSLPDDLQSEKYSYIFKDITAELFDQYILQKREIELSTEHPSQLIQKDSCYIIKRNSATDSLCDNLNDDFSNEYVDYFYKGYWENMDFLVFESAIYEELVYFIYDMNTGTQSYTWNIPHLSPDKNFIVAYSSDLISGFQPTGIQIFRIDDNRIEKEFELEFYEWGPDSCYWVSNYDLIFKRVTLNNDDYSVGEEEFTLLHISPIMP